MIVERFTIPIKPGNLDEALNLLKDGKENIWPFFSCRIYSPYFSEQDTLVVDNDFEDMVEHDKLWEQLFAKEEWNAFIEKWDKLRAGRGTHHIWGLD
jgi:hypothetical protein